MKTIMSISLIAMLFIGGCIGCAGNEELISVNHQFDDAEAAEEKMRQKLEDEQERMRRIAREVYIMMDAEKKMAQQTQPTQEKQEPTAKSGKPAQSAFAVESFDTAKRLILFVAKIEKIDEMSIKTFGQVRALSVIEGVDRWELKVKATYSFSEVLEYLKSFSSK